MEACLVTGIGGRHGLTAALALLWLPSVLSELREPPRQAVRAAFLNTVVLSVSSKGHCGASAGPAGVSWGRVELGWRRQSRRGCTGGDGGWLAQGERVGPFRGPAGRGRGPAGQADATQIGRAAFPPKPPAFCRRHPPGLEQQKE